jgi:hypothetical protein
MKPWVLKPVERSSTTIEGSWLRPAGYCYNLSTVQLSFLVQLLESLGFTPTTDWRVKEGRHYRVGPYTLYNRANTMTMVQWKDMAFSTHNKDFHWNWEQLFEEEPEYHGLHSGTKFDL